LLKVSDGVDNFSLLAIPFFVFAGALMAQGVMAGRLVNFANIFVGFIRGGLAMVNVLASMFFGGISGSSVADVSSIGSILIPMMKKEGYDDEFSVNITITSGTQGIVIPPSHNAVIYSYAAGGAVSTAQLLLAGFIPGVMIGLVTPPVGSTLFVGCAIGKVSIERVSRKLWPFWLSMFVILMLVTYFPVFSMGIPMLAL
jgi:tripartite ATP-independent transporter DctM subunit